MSKKKEKRDKLLKDLFYYRKEAKDARENIRLNYKFLLEAIKEQALISKKLKKLL